MRAIIEQRMAEVGAARTAAGLPLSCGSTDAPPHQFTLDDQILPLNPPVGEFRWLVHVRKTPLFGADLY
jgi:hypothetical protein